VNILATREQKIKFALKRFKGFWNMFKRSKRGMIGLVIIIIFSFIAIFAPFIAPYAPIEPKFGVGEYQALGSGVGLPIAYQLSKPIWYKYLPWIPRGEITTYATAYTYTYQTFQFLIPEEKYDPNLTPSLTPEQKLSISVNDRIYLTGQVSGVKKVEAKLPNQTSIELIENKDWQAGSTISEVVILHRFPDDTQITVTYTTGVDLVENMKIVKDHKLSTPESFEEWNWTTNSKNYINVTYNSQEGLKITGTDDSGCIQISYKNPPLSPPSTVETTLYYQTFAYPYYEPPKRFWIHVSSKATGIIGYYVDVLIYSENEGKEYVLYSKSMSMGDYSPLVVDSNDPKVASNIGVSSHPQSKVFGHPGNFTFGIRIRFTPQNQDATIYIDDVDCLLYGNIFGLLGTDNAVPYPTDLFSAFVYGARVSLIVGVLTALFSTFIGLFLGLFSGYVGGMADEAIMRFADLLLVLPTLPLFIVLVTALRTTSGTVSMWNIIFILTLLGWMSFARSVRSMVLSLKERAFIEAAKAAGGGTLHIINRHLIPNVFALVYITLATSVPGAIITEASLSWLGLGDPRLASWGKILYDFNNSGVVTSKGLLEYWFWVFPTCIAIALLAAAFILLGYALDEILNPRLRERR
jgi:ABC-type dipeptide/oligopeptide/nickel transport system permease subunit